MKKRVLVLLLLLVCLAACHRAPEVTPSPSQTVPPTATPEPTQEARELWGFPIDDTHDAFEVPTGGNLGTVLVTVEQGEEIADEDEFGGYHYTLSVWDKSDLTTPIQTLEETRCSLGAVEISDADFDGHTDFIYEGGIFSQNWPFSLYVWDEENGRFLYKTTLLGRSVSVDEETQTISTYVHYTGYAGADETYRWENGELVCFRIVEYELLNDELQSMEEVTYELVDDKMVEVSRETHAMQGL